MDLGFTAVPAIVVICYLVAQGMKATAVDNKWLPVICGAVGAVLGVLGMWLIPDYPAGDYLTAAAIGIASGFAATGVNQVYKQLTEKKE
jgi:uncharacterized membrane protein YccC